MVKEIELLVEKLVKTYGIGRGRTRAVKDVSFKIQKGNFVALSGHSGSGKSTVFHQIALLDSPTSGKVVLHKKNLSKMSEDEMTYFRLKKIGYVFQHYGLLPELTAFENVILPLMVGDEDMDEVKERAEKVLGDFDLLARKDFYPNMMSGGEQQRISIARALVKNPEIILADEPTANLDSVSGKKVMDILKKLNREKGITVFVINHEKDYEKYFDVIIRLKDGVVDRIDKRKRRR